MGRKQLSPLCALGHLGALGWVLHAAWHECLPPASQRLTECCVYSQSHCIFAHQTLCLLLPAELVAVDYHHSVHSHQCTIFFAHIWTWQPTCKCHCSFMLTVTTSRSASLLVDYSLSCVLSLQQTPPSLQWRMSLMSPWCQPVSAKLSATMQTTQTACFVKAACHFQPAVQARSVMSTSSGIQATIILRGPPTHLMLDWRVLMGLATTLSCWVAVHL